MHTTAELSAVTELSAQSVYRLATPSCSSTSLIYLPLDTFINIDMRPPLRKTRALHRTAPSAKYQIYRRRCRKALEILHRTRRFQTWDTEPSRLLLLRHRI